MKLSSAAGWLAVGDMNMPDLSYLFQKTFWVHLFKFVRHEPPFEPKTILNIGYSIHWQDYDNRSICGHIYRPRPGDALLAKMQSGRTAVFKIKEVHWCNDPHNMYFADVEDYKYLDECHPELKQRLERGNPGMFL